MRDKANTEEPSCAGCSEGEACSVMQRIAGIWLQVRLVDTVHASQRSIIRSRIRPCRESGNLPFTPAAWEAMSRMSTTHDEAHASHLFTQNVAPFEKVHSVLLQPCGKEQSGI
eukprot:1509201-Pleurochrysis_carterae.AAC.3